MGISGCAATPPTDVEGFCNIFSSEMAECIPVVEGIPQNDKKFNKPISAMLGYSAMSEDLNGKIQIYIEELKVQCNSSKGASNGNP